MYLDGTLDGSLTLSAQYSVPSSSPLHIGTLGDLTSDQNFRVRGALSECIIENKVWDATVAANYYNQTKSNY